MNTLLNILNFLKHLAIWLVTLIYSVIMVSFIMLALNVGFVLFWVMVIFSFIGFIYYLLRTIEYYTNVWENLGTFRKSLYRVLTKK